MKNKIFISILLLAVFFVPYSCSDVLDEEVYSELSDSYLKTESGLNTVVYSAYSSFNATGFTLTRDFFINVYMSGIGYGKGGTWETGTAVTFQTYTWDSNNAYFSSDLWNNPYTSIRNANILLDKIVVEDADYSDDYRKLITAEAKGIRGASYAALFNHFGPTPVFTTTETTELELPRASEQEMLTRIETDLTEAAADLPVEPVQYGRMCKGGALGFLCKHYLNTHQWQKAADAAQQIIGLGKYSLQPNYLDAFGPENEGNSEVVWANPADAANSAEFFMALAYPTDFPLPLPSQGTWATRTYLYDSFLDSFEENDSRLDGIATSYVSKQTGETVIGYGEDHSLPIKFGFDPNAVAFFSGIDLPRLRYSDILLARAEALNEIGGPSQEAIDLINQVRARAGISLLSDGDFTQASLRDQILEERFHEFYFEGKEVEDLVRQGKLISDAISRGVNAKEYHVLFPIPQAEIDANTNINENNPGY
nr:RagB/SusD family nutrient uptake outer membrane protein [uncultured Draconibacterium sp.]